MTRLPYNKVIDVADFANPALLPHLHDIAYGEMRRFGLDQPEIISDSKQWECAMMLRALSELGVIRPGALLAGIGAGTEETSFALAAKGCVVFPTDRYLEATPWSDVAPAGMMVRPKQYSDYDYPQGGIIPVHTDARLLSLPSNFFDGVYSAGSIEHFGSLEAVAAAAEEIGRILKPGGVAVISTEFRIDGPNDRRWFDDNCILFTPELLREWIVGPSGLELVDEPDFQTSDATYDNRVVLLDFLAKAKAVKTVTDKRNAYPNLVLFHEGYLFCSVHLALRKPAADGAAPGARAAAFAATVAADATRASGVLTRNIQEWTSTYGQPQTQMPVEVATDSQALRDAEAARAAAETELAIIRQSRSFRLTKPIRTAARIARQTPVVRELGLLTMRALRAARARLR